MRAEAPRPLAFTLIAAVLLLAGCTAASEGPTGGDLNDPGVASYLEENSRALASNYGISDPPDIAPVRLIALDEWAKTQISCLTDAGFEVEETADGEGIQFPVIEEQSLRTALNLAIYTCEMQFPVAPKYMEPLSFEQLERLYDYRSGALVECLEQEGYASLEPAPSKDVFVESGGQWSPYEGQTFGDETQRINEECPQVPGDFYDQ